MTSTHAGFKTVRAGSHLHNYQGFRNFLYLALDNSIQASVSAQAYFCARDIVANRGRHHTQVDAKLLVAASRLGHVARALVSLKQQGQAVSGGCWVLTCQPQGLR